MRALKNSLVRATVFASALGLVAVPAAAGAQKGDGPGGLTSPPPPAAPRAVAFPTPVEKTLKNGLRVIAVERSGMPLVSAELLVKSGGEVDPAGLAGLADTTAELLTKGTEKRSAPEIAEAIEALGGSINSGAAWDNSSVSVTVMSTKIEPALDILADVVRNPSFKQEEIDRYQSQALDDLNLAFSQPGTLARLVAARIVYGDRPYGHPLSGTPESLPKIKREDIVKLHETYYRPDNAIFVVGGDIKPEAAFKLAEKLFGDWEKPKAKLPAAPQTIPPAQKARVVVVDKPDAGQAAVYLTRPGIKRLDPEYFDGIVTNTVLGGGYSARLNQEIRIKRGLSYGARSSLDVRRDVGPFVAATQTKNESGAVVAGLLMSELERLASEPVPPAELGPRKSTLEGNFARSVETTDGLVGLVAAYALNGLPLTSANDFIAKVDKISPAEVQKFAKTRLAPKDASIVIVGDASKFLDELKKQFPNVEVIAADDLDLNTGALMKAKK